MKSQKSRFSTARITLLLIGFCLATSVSQAQPVALQQVLFKDKILANTLNAYCNEAKAEAVRVTVSKQADGFVYYLSKIYFVDDIEDRPTPDWALWKGRIILFYAGSDLCEVCTITDTTAYHTVVRYSESILPRIKLNPKSVFPKAILIEGIEWTFKVDRGRELFFRSNGILDDIPDLLPTVPEKN